MKIYTTYFAKSALLPPDVVAVSIARKTPDKFRGPRYTVLSPTWDILSGWKKNQDNMEYVRRFKADVLGRLDADTVVAELSAVCGGRDFALVCYEKPDDFCHRHLVAKWLREHGYDVEEFNHGGKDNA